MAIALSDLVVPGYITFTSAITGGLIALYLRSVSNNLKEDLRRTKKESRKAHKNISKQIKNLDKKVHRHIEDRSIHTTKTVPSGE